MDLDCGTIRRLGRIYHLDHRPKFAVHLQGRTPEVRGRFIIESDVKLPAMKVDAGQMWITRVEISIIVRCRVGQDMREVLEQLDA